MAIQRTLEEIRAQKEHLDAAMEMYRSQFDVVEEYLRHRLESHPETRDPSALNPNSAEIRHLTPIELDSFETIRTRRAS